MKQRYVETEIAPNAFQCIVLHWLSSCCFFSLKFCLCTAQRNGTLWDRALNTLYINCFVGLANEPRSEKTGFLHMRKQRRRSAAQ